MDFLYKVESHTTYQVRIISGYFSGQTTFCIADAGGASQDPGLGKQHERDSFQIKW